MMKGSPQLCCIHRNHLSEHTIGSMSGGKRRLVPWQHMRTRIPQQTGDEVADSLGGSD
jgi:hypothetical protein